MTTPTTTPPPSPPNRGTDSGPVFSTKTDAFLSWFETFQPELDAVTSWIDDQLTVISNYVLEALGYKNDAEASAEAAQDAASQSIASANFKGEWSALTGSLSVPSSVYHNDVYWMLLNNIPDISLSEPSTSSSDWAAISIGVNRFGITTPFTITIPGKYLVRGSGAVTLPDVSTLADESFNFVAEIDSEPSIFGNSTSDILTKKFGEVDFITLDNQSNYEFIYNASSGKLEV